MCGDGIVEGEEECDGSDACNAACARERVVFITSEAFHPDGIGSLAFADGICRQLAEKAGLQGHASYVAWLSDSSHSAIDRVFHGEGRYVRPDGVTVAASFAALLELDSQKVETIVVETLPDEGLDRAFLDRLRRASAASA